MRYLIINADDFGLCLKTNKVIEHIFNEGLVSSTTLMTPCPGAEDAIRRAIDNKKIKAGLHITTNAEWKQNWGQWKPITPVELVKSLVNDNGYFYDDVPSFAKNAKAAEVAAEIEAQFNFMVSRGVTPTHADSHMGSVYGIGVPSFLKEALEFCAKYKLPFRFPKNIENITRFSGMNPIPDRLRKAHEQAVGYASVLGVKLIDNLFTNNVELSEIPDYDKLKDIYFNLISDLPDGVNEIFMHPSTMDSPISIGRENWILRVWEYRLLMDKDLRNHIEKEKIQLISYSNIA